MNGFESHESCDGRLTDYVGFSLFFDQFSSHRGILHLAFVFHHYASSQPKPPSALTSSAFSVDS